MLPNGAEEMKKWIDMHCADSDELLKKAEVEDMDEYDDFEPDYDAQAEMDEAMLWDF